MALLIIVEDGSASDADVASYAREVLARRVEATTPETRRTAKLDWFVVGALVAVALTVIAFGVAS